jgi:hypothetical protein
MKMKQKAMFILLLASIKATNPVNNIPETLIVKNAILDIQP